jgi:hypothetical protein
MAGHDDGDVPPPSKNQADMERFSSVSEHSLAYVIEYIERTTTKKKYIERSGTLHPGATRPYSQRGNELWRKSKPRKGGGGGGGDK